MSKTIKRELSVADVYNITMFYMQELELKKNNKKSILDKISNLLEWKLKRNVDILKPVAASFEEHKNALRDKINKEWFNDEKSEECEIAKKDSDGNLVLDDKGNTVSEKSRRIKDEFVDDFVKASNEANQKLNEILSDTSEYEINVMDVESEIESFINELDKEDLYKADILMFMNEN